MAELIFVTGASGFLGSHIVIQLLEKGYRVRAAARGPKVTVLKERYAQYGNQFEAVSVSNVAIDQFPEALKGVDAIIHTASPLAGKEEPEVLLHNAKEGGLNVIRQAERAGIKRLVITSSIVAVWTPGMTFKDTDWNPISKEEALSGGFTTYIASKTFAEQAVWEFAESHKDLDITTLLPPFLYGPFAKGWTLSTPDYSALSTDLFIYRFLTPTGSFPSTPGYADVRDVARAHVLALKSPNTSVVGRKRIVFSSPYGFDYKSTIDLIVEKRHDLKDRLANKETAPTFPYDRIPADFGRVEQVLGFKKSEFKTLEETIMDTVEDLLALEKEWKGQGYTVEIPV